MGLIENFQSAVDHYPPDYKPIKTQMISDFARTHEGVWNALHLELLALELLSIVCQSEAKPKAVRQAMGEALASAHDSWGHVYQQLLNAIDEKDARSVKESCQQGGLFTPLTMEPARREVEKLGNVLLDIMTRMSRELEDQTPAQVATNAISRAVYPLGAKHVTTGTTCAGFVDLRDRLSPKLKPLQFSSGAGPKKKSFLLVALLLAVLAVGGGLYASRDTSTATESFQAAREHYTAGDFDEAVDLAESAIGKFKAEGASPKEIHLVRKFLGSAYYKAGDPVAAIQQMKILIKAYPDNQEYKKTLAQLQSEK